MLLRYLFIALLLLSVSSHARDCNWIYRTAISVTENNNDTTSNYQVELTLSGGTNGILHPDYNWSSNGNDLRIHNEDETQELVFSIESWDAINKIATIWVAIPMFQANSTYNMYVSYGNPSAVMAASGLPPATEYKFDKIQFHTRYNTVDPTDLYDAKTLFYAGDDTSGNYSCQHPDVFDGITNAQFGGSQKNFIAYSTAIFEIPYSGNWGIRYGADYGYGGGLYVDGIAWQEKWDQNLWWNNSWSNTSQTLSGIQYLTAGEHLLEIIGAEDGDDGGLTIEFYRESDTQWTSTPENINIKIKSEACPTRNHTVSYGAHDVCDNDLALLSTLSSSQIWIENSDNDVNFQVQNLEVSLDAEANTSISLSLPNGISLSNSAGTNWNCTGSTTVNCVYNTDIEASSVSSTLTLTFTVTATTGSNLNLSSTVTGSRTDDVTANNSLSTDISILTAGVVPSGCSPQSGLLVSFYDTSGQTSSVDDNSDFNALIASYTGMGDLIGQTVYPNINSSGSPFIDENNSQATALDHSLAIFNGYINYTGNNAPSVNFYVDIQGSVESFIDNGSGQVQVNDRYDSNYASRRRNNTRATISPGFNGIQYRVHNAQGLEEYDFYWRNPITSNREIISSDVFYHCGGSPDINILSEFSISDDRPINSVNPKAIPGAIVEYTVTVSNDGQISSDLNSIQLVQKITAGSELYLGSLGAELPITFENGSGDEASGLTYTYSGNINDVNDDISFSTDGSDFTHTVTNTNGYDSDITHFKLDLKGAMKPTYNGNTPNFNFKYKLRVK